MVWYLIQMTRAGQGRGEGMEVQEIGLGRLREGVGKEWKVGRRGRGKTMHTYFRFAMISDAHSHAHKVVEFWLSWHSFLS